VAAFALVNMLGQTKLEGVDLKSYCAGGFKDITRIASSRPELWRDICLLNRKAVSKSLGHYIGNLQRMKRWIDNSDGRALENEFARANVVREEMA
jgi:prephenate dehydrogenase